jgi:disulfide bond formation protein DsbB
VKHQKFILFAWVIALTASLSSVYISEVLQWSPCILCWYQRICMFPLAILLPMGVIRRDRELPYLALPLSVIGSGIALFHLLLQEGVIPEAAAPCVSGASCLTRHVLLFGFVTIPYFSLIAFLLITISLILSIKLKNHVN